MTQASCLCGAVRWHADGPLEFMSHCHCSRCRKKHGTAFATFVVASARGFELDGRDQVVTWKGKEGGGRCFCGQCGSSVPGPAWGDRVFLPAGSFDGDPGARPEAHMFVASKAPWYEIRDQVPQFEAYPPGVDAPSLATRPALDPPGRPRGSCLCGAVTYRLDGQAVRCVHCHCSRCRKARSAAHASNIAMREGSVHFTRGADQLAAFKLPSARFFTQVFCRNCGSPMPVGNTGRGIEIVPMGGLDDDPGIRPSAHIFVGSKAPFFDIADGLPQYAESFPTT